MSTQFSEDSENSNYNKLTQKPKEYKFNWQGIDFYAYKNVAKELREKINPAKEKMFHLTKCKKDKNDNYVYYTKKNGKKDHDKIYYYAKVDIKHAEKIIKRANSQNQRDRSFVDPDIAFFEICDTFPLRVYFDIDDENLENPISLDFIKNTILEYFPGEKLAISGGIDGKKVSYHIVLPDIVLNNKNDLMILNNLVKYLNQNVHSAFDYRVYSENKNMKIPGFQKDPTRAPQKIIEEPDFTRHLICTPFLTCFEKPAILPKLKLAETEEKVKENPIFKTVKEYFSTISEDIPNIKYKLLDVINREKVDIDKLKNYYPMELLKITPNGPEFSHAHTFLVCKFCVLNGISFSNFWEWAKIKRDDENRKSKWYNYFNQFFNEIDRKPNKKLFPPYLFYKVLSKYYKELNEYFKENDIYTTKFLQSFNIEQEEVDEIKLEYFDFLTSTLIFSFSMGGGKTYFTIKFLAKQNDVSFIWIIPRTTLCSNTIGRLKENGIDVLDYSSGENAIDKDLILNNPENKTPRIIICCESLHFLTKETINKFQYVIIDEVETLFNSIGNKTHGENMEQNFNVLKNLLTSPNVKKNIFLDAFTTKTTTDLLDDLNLSYKIYKNKNLPVEKIIHFNPNNEETLNIACNKIKEGKKIFIFYAKVESNSKTQGIEMFKNYLLEITKQLLPNGEYKYKKILLYHSKVDDKTKNDLQNANSIWAEQDVIICTNSITVGVSYDEYEDKMKMFDSVFIFTNYRVLPRDFIQSSMRIRNTLTSDIYLTYMDYGFNQIEENPPYFITYSDQIFNRIINNKKCEKMAHPLISLLEFCKICNYNADSLSSLRNKDDVKDKRKFIKPDVLESKRLMEYTTVSKITQYERDVIENLINKRDATYKQKFEIEKYHFDSRFKIFSDEERANIWNNKYDTLINVFFDIEISDYLDQLKAANNADNLQDIDYNKLIITPEMNKYVNEKWTFKNKLEKYKHNKILSLLLPGMFTKKKIDKEHYEYGFNGNIACLIFDYVERLKTEFYVGNTLCSGLPEEDKPIASISINKPETEPEIHVTIPAIYEPLEAVEKVKKPYKKRETTQDFKNAFDILMTKKETKKKYKIIPALQLI